MTESGDIRPNANFETDRYWNRETSAPGQFSTQKSFTKETRIICISDPDDDANKMIYDGKNYENGRVLAIGSKTSDFDLQKLRDEEANVVFCSHPKSYKPLEEILQHIPTIEWVHSRSAGIDHMTSSTLAGSGVTVTNAKGCFSSTLGEYTMMAISYFAKDLPRLLKQKHGKQWEKYCVEEIRSKTLGIVGYGDIGRSAARLAKAYGMKVKALRRNPQLSKDDKLCDTVYSCDKKYLHRMMSECDYILCAAPLTPNTRGMFDKEAFGNAKPNSVFINVGRGPIVDEDALIDAIKRKILKGAALDVFETEPLPKESELWSLDNVLISPHNQDMTKTFMHESSEFFINENCPRFVRGDVLLNPVDTSAGY